MAIYSNNLDEFFRVRVANHRNLLRVGKNQAQLDYDPKDLIKEIKVVNLQQERFTRIFNEELLPELSEHRGTDDPAYRSRRIRRHLSISTSTTTCCPMYSLSCWSEQDPAISQQCPLPDRGPRDKSRSEHHRGLCHHQDPSDHIPRFIILPRQVDNAM